MRTCFGHEKAEQVDEAGEQPQQLGEVITADHIVNPNEHDNPVHAHKAASVV